MPTAEEFRQQEIIHDDEEDEPALLTTTWENLNIYEVDRENREVHRLLDTRFLPSDSLRRGDKWIDFDVTPALTRRRKEDSNDLIEFYIKRLVSNATPMSIDLRDSAALIVQIETPETANQSRRRKRSTKKNKNRRRKPHHNQPKAKNLCRLESLWVDFKQLDWDDWIISPAAYDAYQCRGKCTDAPPSARQNYSNHAIMQTLIHSLNASAVPPPCCVPTEMSPLPILYRDVHNTTIVHKYPDMIVEACGCH
uniref:TGF-beta family profile domain-containing protein n=1 Tax=Panagrolaimus sp. ES5 TaxID=591445 RepID=A0AC34FZH6_9BILA